MLALTRYGICRFRLRRLLTYDIDDRSIIAPEEDTSMQGRNPMQLRIFVSYADEGIT